MPRIHAIAKDGTKVYRRETIKVIASEEDVLTIVKPLLDFAAYSFSITKHNAMPTKQSFKSALMFSKTRLASLLGHKLERIVDPNNLMLPSVEIITSGGYIDISFDELLAKDGDVTHRYSWKLRLQDETGVSFFEKVLQVLKRKHPDWNDEKLVAEASDWIGLY